MFTSQSPAEALDKQREIAFTIRVERANEEQSEAPRAAIVTKVLHDLLASYDAFLLAEFLREENFARAYKQSPETFASVKQALDLRVVQVKFSSCQLELAPAATSDPQLLMFTDEVKDWEERTFARYRDEVIAADFSNPEVLNQTIKRYTDPTQRSRIFKPLFDLMGDGKEYVVQAGSRPKASMKRLIRPSKVLRAVYAPRLSNPEPLPDKMMLVYAKVPPDHKGNYKLSGKSKVLYMQETLPVYPFRTNTLRFDGYAFGLTRQVSGEVVYEDEQFIITSQAPDITVWGNTREEAEEAFAFAFYAMYENYYQASDEDLAPSGLVVKQMMLELIQEVYTPKR